MKDDQASQYIPICLNSWQFHSCYWLTKVDVQTAYKRKGLISSMKVVSAGKKTLASNFNFKAQLQSVKHAMAVKHCDIFLNYFRHLRYFLSYTSNNLPGEKNTLTNCLAIRFSNSWISQGKLEIGIASGRNAH